MLPTPEMLFVKNNVMVMKQRNEMKANMPEKVMEKESINKSDKSFPGL